MRNLLAESINAQVTALRCIFEAHDPQGRNKKLIHQELENVRTRLNRLAGSVSNRSGQTTAVNSSMGASSVVSLDASRTHRWKRTMRNPEQRLLVQRVILQLQPIWRKSRLVLLMQAWKRWSSILQSTAVHDAHDAEIVKTALVGYHPFHQSQASLDLQQPPSSPAIAHGWNAGHFTDMPEDDTARLTMEDVDHFSSAQRAVYGEDYPLDGQFGGSFEFKTEPTQFQDYDDDTDYERFDEIPSGDANNADGYRARAYSSSSEESSYSRNQLANVIVADGRPFLPTVDALVGSTLDEGDEDPPELPVNGFLLSEEKFGAVHEEWESFHLRWQKHDHGAAQQQSSHLSAVGEFSGSQQAQAAQKPVTLLPQRSDSSSPEDDDQGRVPFGDRFDGSENSASNTPPSVNTHISAKDFLSRLATSPQHAASRFRPSDARRFIPFVMPDDKRQFGDDYMCDGVEYEL